MKVSKDKALKLVDEKISQFQEILAKAKYENRYDEAYELAYYGTEGLLTKLFSKEEAMEFRRNVTSMVVSVGGKVDYEEELQDYKKHINSCIAQLKVFRDNTENFWGTGESEAATKSTVVPFVSMSFEETDKDINSYVIGILNALQIKFQTGERYSKESIPEKVMRRIKDSDLFIAIFVKRDKIEGNGYTTPSWLLKELGIAQGKGKGVIAWVERDIKDIAGLNYEKEVIYFERDNIREIEKATIKFLEALREHKLV